MDNCQIAITKDFPPGRTWLLLTRSLAVARISPRLDPGAKCPADDDDDDDDNDDGNDDCDDGGGRFPQDKKGRVLC